MEDIIHLLPDSVANQIAAGEVIQRPASAVKELLENAIDAGAKHIQLIIKDAGRTLIQVIDDGKGMSFNDARLCFERHATSKLSKAEDLYSLTTKGFRGEALASIAAIAQIELKTRRKEDEMATLVFIEGSEIKSQEPTTAPLGTSISVKNLFFNVPARRNFLKSDATELAAITEELNRLAIIHTNIEFIIYHNGKLLQQLPATNLKQRIVGLFGNSFKDKLFPIEQETSFMKISGYLGKPENAKKKKGEQYLFINHRYVHHNSLCYAIESAYSKVLPEGQHPPFFICIEVNPATVDINISPTKVEVKLQDERLIFGFLNAAVKKAIGEFSLIPQLDFDYNKELDIDNIPEDAPLKTPTISLDPNYNPFKNYSIPSKNSSHSSGTINKSVKFSDTSNSQKAGHMQNWESFLENIKETSIESSPSQPMQLNLDTNTVSENVSVDNYLIIQQRFLVVKIKEELWIIHITRAYERIIYENFMNGLKNKAIAVQQSLFPETITLTPTKGEILNEIRGELYKLGYDIEPISNTNFAINGTPNNEEEGDLQNVIENLIDDYQSNMMSHRLEMDKNIALSMARQKKSYMKPLTSLLEVNNFLQQLFSCILPTMSPTGKKVYEIRQSDDLEKLF